MLNPLVRAHLLACVLIPLCSAAGGAQRDRAPFRCAGEPVSYVEIQPSPPPFSGAAKKWVAAAHTVGLHHATTRPWIIAAFLSLEPGQPCSEFRRAESERVLRAQPFLADAVVRVIPDTGGQVAVIVTTTDEIPVLVSGRVRGVMPESFSLGNENLGGAALRLEGRIERGRAYRTAFGGRIEQDALFGRPYRVILDADRYQLGHRVGAAVEHPFFTDLQRISWHAGLETRDDYLRFERLAGDPLALRMRDKSWDMSALLRLFGTETVALLGGAITGRQFDPAAAGIVIDDTGLRADTGVTLRQRYSTFRVGRVGVTGGIRRVSFRTVRGFDALVASQDVAHGAMLGLFAAKGLSRFGENDFYLSSAFYAGASRGNALLATLAQVEGRRDMGSREWDSVIGSARTAFYMGSAPGVVLIVADEISGGATSRTRLPLQLSFGDGNGGLSGYRYSGLAGERRNIVRAEARWSAESLIRRADVGVAAFSEVGTLWAGNAPYGVNATRTTVGVSLLAAYPTRAKRLYRADLAIPLVREGMGGGRVELRFTSADRTQGFWTEPIDLTRARTATEPSKLFAWPTR